MYKSCEECEHHDTEAVFNVHHVCLLKENTDTVPTHLGTVLPDYPEIPEWCPLMKSIEGDSADLQALRAKASDLKQDELPENEEDLTPYQKLKKEPIGVIVETFAATRDYLKAERKKFKDLETATKADLEMMETIILEKQRELGLQSISTGDYTAFQTEKTYIRMGDWDTFSEWVLKTGNVQCLEKRCAKLACLEVEEVETQRLIQESGDEEAKFDLADVGIEKSSEIAVQVRKK